MNNVSLILDLLAFMAIGALAVLIIGILISMFYILDTDSETRKNIIEKKHNCSNK